MSYLSDFSFCPVSLTMTRESSQLLRVHVVRLKVKVLVSQLCPTLCHTTDYEPARLLCPWNSSGKNTGVGCHALPSGDFPDPGMELTSLMSSALAGGFFTTEPPGKPQ